jgi:hypothetical protein
MSKLNWLFPSRRAERPPVDGATVLDRLEARLGLPVRGEARLVLAGQLEIAVSRIREQPSHSTAALAAHREGVRIAALLPRPFASALGSILADELVRSRRVSPEHEQQM